MKDTKLVGCGVLLIILIVLGALVSLFEKKNNGTTTGTGTSSFTPTPTPSPKVGPEQLVIENAGNTLSVRTMPKGFYAVTMRLTPQNSKLLDTLGAQRRGARSLLAVGRVEEGKFRAISLAVADKNETVLDYWMEGSSQVIAFNIAVGETYARIVKKYEEGTR